MPRRVHTDLPLWVSRFTDRHGKPRYRFRRQNARGYSFKAAPGTPDFAAEYEMCLRGEQPASEQRRRPRKSTNVEPAAGAPQVYFIGGASGPIKIGFSMNPAERLADIARHHPGRLKLLAVIAGDQAAEAHLHARFEASRVRGEWFRRTPDLVALIKTLREQAMANPAFPVSQFWVLTC